LFDSCYRLAHSLNRYPIHLTIFRSNNSLEEYLHDLVGHLPIEERRKVAADASLDFTEAALVLQNSSNIYSRKVDYFYTLVYQALNDLAGSVDAASGAGQHNNKRNKTAGDIEIDDFHAFDPHQEFLLLDDVLPVDETDNCEKINLPESIDDASMTRTNRLSMNQPTGMTASTGKNQNQNQTARLSLGVTLGGDFSTTMDRSVQSMNAAAHRALIGSLDTGSLRLIDGQCDIDESGVLLMPGTASQRSTTNFSSQETMPQNDLVAHDDNEFGGGNHDDYDEGDDDGGGFAFGDDQEMPPAPEAFSETHNRVSFAETLNQPQKKKRADPWELLDPHTPDSVKARPLRIGKTIKLPPGVDELPSDCVTGARTRRATRRKKVPLPPVLEKPTKSLATEIFKATMAARKRSHNETSLDDEFVGVDEEAASFPSVPLKGLVFGDEFAYIAKASAKRKAAERRERRKQQLATNVPSVPEEDDNYDNDDDGGFAFGGMDDGDDGDDGDFGGAFDNDNNGSVVGNTGMASVDEVYDAQGNLGTWTESLSCCFVYYGQDGYFISSKWVKLRVLYCHRWDLNVLTIAFLIFSLFMHLQTTRIQKPKPLKNSVEPTFKSLLGERKSTLPRLNFPYALDTGKKGSVLCSKRKSNVLNSIFTPTDVPLLIPWSKRSDVITPSQLMIPVFKTRQKTTRSTFKKSLVIANSTKYAACFWRRSVYRTPATWSWWQKGTTSARRCNSRWCERILNVPWKRISLPVPWKRVRVV
jgi:hypothetical protein